MANGVEKLVQYLDSIYAFIVKPAILLLFRLYYSRAIPNKLKHSDQDVLFYSASFLARQIRDKQVRNMNCLKH